MDVKTACSLVEGIVYKPGWSISARDHRSRFGEAICLHVDYEAHQWDRDEAPAYSKMGKGVAPKVLLIDKVQEAEELYRMIMEHLLDIEEHEAREAFRIQPTLWGPYNPHHPDGMRRWGRVEHDLAFGAVT